MSITSYVFFIFIAVVLFVYYFCVPKRFQWVALLVASYTFYYFAGVELFLWMLTTTLTVYFAAIRIAKSQSVPAKRGIIALTAVCNFGFLAFFKWYNTLAGLFNRLSAGAFQLPMNTLLLPLGISFYTFQAIGYLVDVYRGTVKPERNPARFALFVSFFPQLIQGPISRHNQLADQLYASRKPDYTQVKHGFQLMLWGLFKKLVIADRLVLMGSAIFGSPQNYPGLYIPIGLIASALQLYTDFSGGVDIARGVAQMLGIVMPQNFRRPFFAASLPEYWRRWHMTLNEWWRDYLFYPLALSKPLTKFSRFIRKHLGHELGKVISVYLCINVVRVVNAMWHGASFMYVASGFYHGILIVLGMVCAPLFKKVIRALRINTSCASWKFFQILRTFLLVCLARVFLMSSGFINGLRAIKSMVVNFNPWIINFDSVFLIGLSRRDVRIILFSLLVLLVVSILQERGIEMRKMLEKQNILFQWLLMIGCLVIILLWGRYGYGYDPAAFIYMGF